MPGFSPFSEFSARKSPSPLRPLASSADSDIYGSMQSLPIDSPYRRDPPPGRAGRTPPPRARRKPPGSGKTTRMSHRLWRNQASCPDRIAAVVMLQPRRVAARASARRIADENGWTLGEEVGYQIRGERRVSSRTRSCGSRPRASSPNRSSPTRSSTASARSSWTSSTSAASTPTSPWRSFARPPIPSATTSS